MSKKIIINENNFNKILSFLNEDFQNQYTIVSSYIKNGYLCHGTSEEFDLFDEAKIKGGFRSEFGYGIYFSNETYKCLEYGDKIYITKKDLYNFWDLDGKDISKFQEYFEIDENIMKYEYELDNCYNNKDYDYYNNLIEQLKEEKNKFSYKEKDILDIFKLAFNKYPNNLENVFKYVKNNVSSDYVPIISSLLLKLGYDGVKCENQFVIFNFNKLNNNFKLI